MQETLIEFKPRAFEACCNRIEARYDSIKRRGAGHALYEVTTETIDARRDEIPGFLGVDSKLAPRVETADQRQNSSSHGLVMTA